MINNLIYSINIQRQCHIRYCLKCPYEERYNLPRSYFIDITKNEIQIISKQHTYSNIIKEHLNDWYFNNLIIEILEELTFILDNSKDPTNLSTIFYK